MREMLAQAFPFRTTHACRAVLPADDLEDALMGEGEEGGVEPGRAEIDIAHATATAIGAAESKRTNSGVRPSSRK